MNKDFAVDLRVARRASGLSQADCAHLLRVDPTRISKFESGDRAPSLREMCALSIIYDQPDNQLCGTVTEEILLKLRERLASMPDCPANWRAKAKRTETIHRLALRLSAIKPDDHDGA